MPRLLPLLLCAAALVAGPPPAEARAAVWCAVMHVGHNAVITDCSFPTLEQCVPYVIAGNRGFCQQNPAYEGPVKRKRAWRSRR